MITHPIQLWIFTIAFICIALYLLARLVSERRNPGQAVSHGLHALMALDMVAMAWPWWEVIPWWPQLILFSVATGWFLVMALLRARRIVPRDAVVGHTAWHQLVHALMMGAMVWMVAVMAPGQGAGHAHHDHGEMSGAAAAAGLVLVVLLLVAVLLEIWNAGTLMRKRENESRAQVLERAVMAVMLAGMAWMCWLML